MHTTALGHSDVAGGAPWPAGEFVAGEWLVEPDLNQISRGGVLVHVRPQLMDLLVYLASNSGRTVPHDELLANVWPGQPFVTGSALPRCIAELRQALGDRASGSTVIQTIPKRGYRLIAAVRPAGDVMPVPIGEAGGPPSPLPELRSGDPKPAGPRPAPPLRSTAAPSTTSTPMFAWLLRARQFAARVLGSFRSRRG